AIEARAEDARRRDLLDRINAADDLTALTAERAFLAVLDGSCRTPIAGNATLEAGRLRLRGLIAKPDGSAAFETAREGSAADAAALGSDAVRVLLTRPEPDGERTATALRARGCEVLLAPLLAVAPVESAELGSGPWQAVAMTSANAARAVKTHPRLVELLRLPVFTVGRHTAEAARAIGFAAVTSADGNAQDLARLIGVLHGGEGAVLYLAGEARAGDLAGDAARYGVKVDTVVIYRAVALSRFPPLVQTALTAGHVDAVLHFSRRSAEVYIGCANTAGIRERAVMPLH